MMNIEQEIKHLKDLMPASGRMLTNIVNKPQQPQVIYFSLPLPWQKKNNRKIYINFDLWSDLSRSQRDILLLRTTTSVMNIRWFKPDVDQLLILAGLVGLTTEIMETDIVGIIVAGSLTAIASNRVWRRNHSMERELEVDEAALKIAARRGYTETQAAQNLLEAIESVAKIERRPLSFIELVRSQNLKGISRKSNLDNS